MKTCVFIVPQLSQPRCIKRIKSIYDAGIPIKVYGFDRGLYSENIANIPFPVERIIVYPGKNKFSRLFFIIKTIRNIIRTNKKDSVFYLFSFEVAYYATMMGCKNYIYEEADVSAVKKRFAWQRKYFLRKDRNLVQNAKLAIFTSQGFVEYIFGDKSPKNLMLLPNKLSPFFTDEKRDSLYKHEIDVNHLRFAFIGLVRYFRTILGFAKVVGEKFPQHEFHFYGDASNKELLKFETEKYKNIYIHGAFSNPQDLEKIYSNVDINIVCYDPSSINVRIAEPNKLYESIYFRTPIVVSKETYLERRVLELGIGTSIDCTKSEDIESFIKSISISDIDKYIKNMNSISSEQLIDNADEIIFRISEIL